MNYKETLFFVAKCLTINHEEHNKIIVENLLKSNAVDWDAVVKLSTAHYVFPALYCNLKRASFLSYLPEELVEYMKYITDLNRDRNKEIIEQAKELNELLLQNKITPIFLKGTGNLLEGLYEDIGERMVGDIDFIFSEKDCEKTNLLLIKNGYSRVDGLVDVPREHRHLPRLIKDNRIAAIEIHKKLTIEKYSDEFNYNFIKNNCQKFNEITVMSFENQLSLSIISQQINDHGIHYKNISLRNSYDVFLLSKKVKPKNIFNQFHKLRNPLNNFLASCFEVFNKPKILLYNSTKETAIYLTFFNKHLNNSELRKRHQRKTKNIILIKDLSNNLYKIFFDKSHRLWFFKRVANKNWRHEKMIQLGLKKSKLNF